MRWVPAFTIPDTLTEGVVTISDLFQTMAGNMMPGADDPEQSLAVQREDGSWLLDGLLPIDQLQNKLEIPGLGEDANGLYHTVGGFVVTQKNFAMANGSSRSWIWITTGSTRYWPSNWNQRSGVSCHCEMFSWG